MGVGGLPGAAGRLAWSALTFDSKKDVREARRVSISYGWR